MKTQSITKGFLLLLLLTFQMSFGQFQTQAPTITPVSPEAASLGRYGNVDLTSATGQMNYGIPLYNITVDGNSWPINLNYSYGGLILEGKPSLSGLGWNLSAYASISKEVRGLPDGHKDGYYGINNRKANIDGVISDYFDGEQGQIFNYTMFRDLEKFKNGEWDSEADKYTVSIAGERFSFKLRKNGTLYEPYYLSKHNYVVEVVSMDQAYHFEIYSFSVRDDKGIIYHFKGNHREGVDQDPAGTQVYYDNSTTSWMLSEIEYANGQTINFSYTEDFYDSWDFSASGYEQDLDIANGPPHPDVADYSQGYSESMVQNHMKRQILNSISFPSGSISLTTDAIDSRKVFSTMVVKDKKQTAIDTYNFTYTGNRDALTKITKNGEDYYDFEYFGINDVFGGLPEFINSSIDYPNDQDFWKFYNAAGNNRAINMPNDSEQYHVDKSPNFNATRLGALNKIKYPTRGYTQVEYEPNQVKEDFTGQINGPVTLNRQILLKLNPTPSNSEKEVIYTHTFDYPTRASISHLIDGRIWGNYFELSITKNDDCNLPSACYDLNTITYTHYPEMADHLRDRIGPGSELDECTYYPIPIMCPTFFSSPTGPDDHPTPNIYQEDSSRGEIYISPGTYTFKITTRAHPNSSVFTFTEGEMYGEIRVLYYDPSDSSGNTPEYINADVGGIRVKRISNYDNNGSHESSKNYSYNDDEGFSTARLNQQPLYTNVYTWHHTDDTKTPSSWTDVTKEYLLNAYTALNSSHGLPVYYSQVKTYDKVKLGINPNSINSSGSLPLYKEGSSGTALPSDTNPDGSKIVTAVGSGVTGTMVNNDPAYFENGYTIQTFNLPAEDLTYAYPKIPRMEDITKAQPNLLTVYDNTDASVSTKGYVYAPFRHTLINDTTNDLDTNHPWSFKYYKTQISNINWSDPNCSGCYHNPNPDLNTVGDIALKDLHDIALYKEVNLKNLGSGNYSSTQGVSVSQTMTYDSYQQLKSIITTDSEGVEIKTEYDYPYNISEPQYDNMVTTNQIAIPVQQRAYRNSVLMSSQKTNFTLVGNAYKTLNVLSAKGSEILKEELKFTYNSTGNIIQYIKNDGSSPPTAIVWGYNNSQPIAKIDNATYASISSLVSSLDLVGLSNDDDDRTIGSLGNEGALRVALESFRTNPALDNATVTTYTYDPLIGVTSITDPRGNTVYYEYDTQHRLEFVKDKDGNLLSENKYHYKD